LEYGIHRPLVRGHALDLLAVDPDGAARCLLEAADEVECRRLAAAAGAEQGEELPLADHEVELVQGDGLAEVLCDPLQLDRGGGHGVAHARPPDVFAPRPRSRNQAPSRRRANEAARRTVA